LRTAIDTAISRRGAAALLAAACLALLGGCMVKETRPLPKLAAVQATSEIPAEQLLDVGVRLFDPNIPKEVEQHAELAEKQRIYPDIRKAEARYMPTLLRATLEGTGQWGAVRVIPTQVAIMDVMVAGRILESSGLHLALEATVSDATGRHWFTRRYEQDADTSSYREGPGRARDPFQNIYVNIANDMLAYRAKLPKEQLAMISRIQKLRFGDDLAPATYDGFLAKDKPRDGQSEFRVVRLPAEGDPIVERVDRIRERDSAMIDTVSEHYAGFAEKMAEPYSGWRRSTYDELEQEQKQKDAALTRKVLGAAAIVGGIVMPNMCGGNYICGNAQSVARAAAIGGGVMGIMSGFEKGKAAQMHTDAIKEITGSFQAEAAPLVVDVEGRTLKLTGSAEAQYAEWRRLLRDLYQEETGLGTQASSADPAPSTPVPAADHSRTN
jgi:hypothetical protein